MNIDEIDRKLIRELQKDGRKSCTELGKALGVVEGTVRRRIKKLLENNLIRIVAVPNLKALGYTFLSIVGIQVETGDLSSVAEDLCQRSCVCRIAFVIGRYDLLAIFITRSAEEFSQFMRYEVPHIPGIVKAETFATIEYIKGGWLMPDTTQLIEELDVSSRKTRKEPAKTGG